VIGAVLAYQVYTLRTRPAIAPAVSG